MENGYFKYAWILEKLMAEYRSDRFIYITLCEFKTTRYYATIINSPEYHDFIESIITDTSELDCALLIIAAGVGESEAGTSKTGQTHKHALLSYTIGVKKIIVGVKKLELTESPYSEVRVTEMKKEVSNYITKMSKKSTPHTFGSNIGWNTNKMLELSHELAWFKRTAAEVKERKAYEKYVINALYGIMTPSRLTDEALRSIILDLYKIESLGSIIFGRMEIRIFKMVFGNWCDQGTGKNTKTNPKAIKPEDSDIMNLVITDRLCAKDFAEFHPLLNFVMYDMIKISDTIESVSFKDLFAGKGIKDKK